MLFLLMVVWLYRVSQDRKRISLQLEQRGMELEEEVQSRKMHNRALSELSLAGVFQIDVNGRCRNPHVFQLLASEYSHR